MKKNSAIRHSGRSSSSSAAAIASAASLVLALSVPTIAQTTAPVHGLVGPLPRVDQQTGLTEQPTTPVTPNFTLAPGGIYHNLELAPAPVLTTNIVENGPISRLRGITWSILNEGVIIEPNPGTLYYAGQTAPSAGFPGQGDTPFDEIPEEDPDYFPGIEGFFDEYANVLEGRLTNDPPPFGFEGAGGTEAWVALIREAFNRWEIVGGINFVEVTDSGSDWDRLGWGTGDPDIDNTAQGDIRIAMTIVDGPSQPDGSFGNRLAYTYPAGYPLPGDELEDMDTKDPEDDEANVGYFGNIILDREEKWNDPSTPNLLLIVMIREIGTAIGLYPSCPNAQSVPFSVMQNQIFNPDDGDPTTPNVSEPFPQLFYQTPQIDDVRALHSLYGDRLESNDFFTDAVIVDYAPNPQTNVFRFAPHLAQPSAFFSQFPLSPDGNANPVQLSLSLPLGEDIFRFVLPESVTTAVMRVTVSPVGNFDDGDASNGDSEDFFIDGEFDPTLTTPEYGNCTNTTVTRFPRRARDLQFTINAFDPFTNTFTELATVNDNVISATVPPADESIEIVVSAGTYFVTVAGDAVDDVQLYNLTVEFETPLTDTGVDFSRLADVANVEAARDELSFGGNARIGVIDGLHPADQHLVFSGRTLPRVTWTGSVPSLDQASSHATTVAAVAAGSPLDTFEGVAPQADIASASIAEAVFEDGTFRVSKNALQYGLFSLANNSLAQSNGLPGAVDVIVSTWNGGGRSLDAEDIISRTYDAAAFMNDVTIVAAAGNGGQFDGQSFGNCVLVNPDQEGPGGEYLGSRTISAPATAFNVISVGAVGEVDSNPDTLPNDLLDENLPANVLIRDLDVAVAGFSSKGQIDAAILTTTTTTVTANVRSGVDIVAPGTGIIDLNDAPVDPCDFQGNEANQFVFLPAIEDGDDPDAPAVNDAFALTQGTSVAAGMVGGAVALLSDVAREQDDPLSTHPVVMKAILLNSARKLVGWNNSGVGPGRPQDQRDGFALNVQPVNVLPNTTNPLDPAQGAGVLDIERALQNYVLGYPPAAPPQATFDGITIDPPQTDPRRPTIRMPDEPSGTGIPGSAPDIDAEAISEPALGEAEIKQIQIRHYGRDEYIDTFMGSSSQDAGPRDPDLKFGTGNGGIPDNLVTGAQTPFLPPSLGDPGDDGGSEGPTGPPGAVDPGVRPREIEPILVDPIGWDHGNIDQRAIRQQDQSTQVTGFIDYIINVPLLASRPNPNDPDGAPLPADRLTVTLCWLRELVLDGVNFSNENAPNLGTVGSLELENLNLFVFQADSFGNPTGAARFSSTANFSTTEHVFGDIPQDGIYMIRVQWVGTLYDLFFDRPLAETEFGVAWRVDFSPRETTLARATGMSELTSVLGRFGSKVGHPMYDLPADFTSDGLIDFEDVMFVITNWEPEAAE